MLECITHHVLSYFDSYLYWCLAYICEGIFDLRIYVVVTSLYQQDWGITFFPCASADKANPSSYGDANHHNSRALHHQQDIIHHQLQLSFSLDLSCAMTTEQQHQFTFQQIKTRASEAKSEHWIYKRLDTHERGISAGNFLFLTISILFG